MIGTGGPRNDGHVALASKLEESIFGPAYKPPDPNSYLSGGGIRGPGGKIYLVPRNGRETSGSDTPRN